MLFAIELRTSISLEAMYVEVILKMLQHPRHLCCGARLLLNLHGMEILTGESKTLECR